MRHPELEYLPAECPYGPLHQHFPGKVCCELPDRVVRRIHVEHIQPKEHVNGEAEFVATEEPAKV
jgi:hypothetical protein